MKTGSLEAVSNRATFQTIRQMVDTETGQPVDLTGAAIVFEISDQGCRYPRLSATIDNGKIIMADPYTYQVTFSRDDMKTLCAGTYDVGLTATRDDFTSQIIIGTLPVLEGDVT